MDLLDARVGILEDGVLGAVDGTGQQLPHHDLEGQVSQLQGKWKASIDRGAELRAVVDALQTYSVLLQDRGDLSTEAKRVLLAANQDFLQETARHLALVESHQVYINSVHTTQDLDKHKDAVAKLLPVHLTQKEQAIWLNEHVEILLQSHHDVVSAISSQLLRLDALLQQMENAAAHTQKRSE